MTVTVTKPAFNLREVLNSLKRITGSKGTEIMRASTVDDVYNSIGQNKNIIINGTFAISQRGDYATSAVTLNTNQYYVDRWKCYRSAMAGTIQFVSATINGASLTSAKFVATNTATGELLLEQIVESANIVVGKTYTYSVWVKTTNRNCTARLFKGDSWIQSAYHSGSGQWERLSVTWTAVTSGSHYSHQLYCNSHTSGDVYEFALPQLELGSVATPFEFRNNGLELLRCQRYYEIGEIAFPGSLSICSGMFTVQKRAVPTMTRVSNVYSGAEAGTFVPFSSIAYYVHSPSTWGGGRFTAEAEL